MQLNIAKITKYTVWQSLTLPTFAAGAVIGDLVDTAVKLVVVAVVVAVVSAAVAFVDSFPNERAMSTKSSSGAWLCLARQTFKGFSSMKISGHHHNPVQHTAGEKKLVSYSAVDRCPRYIVIIYDDDTPMTLVASILFMCSGPEGDKVL